MRGLWQLLCETLTLLVHAAPFSADELALLSAMIGLSALSPSLVADALRVVTFRLHNPSASRWHAPSAASLLVDMADRDEEAGGSCIARDDAITSLSGVLVSTELLLAVNPEVRPGRGQAPVVADEAELLRRAERMLRGVQGL